MDRVRDRVELRNQSIARSNVSQSLSDLRAAVAIAGTKSIKSSLRPSSAKESKTTRVGSNSLDTKHWRKDEWSKDVYKHVALHDKGF